MDLSFVKLHVSRSDRRSRGKRRKIAQPHVCTQVPRPFSIISPNTSYDNYCKPRPIGRTVIVSIPRSTTPLWDRERCEQPTLRGRLRLAQRRRA